MRGGKADEKRTYREDDKREEGHHDGKNERSGSSSSVLDGVNVERKKEQR